MSKKREVVSLMSLTFLMLTIITWTSFENSSQSRRFPQLSSGVDTNRTSTHLYIVTPTFSRLEQEPELVRLGQTLQQVDDMTWIVVEDARTVSSRLKRVLKRFEMMNIIVLAAQMPSKYKSLPMMPKGVSGRNKAMNWVLSKVAQRRDHSNGGGVLYFADDDNTYDLRLFDQIRLTKRLSMFPVGLISNAVVSSPIVSDGKIVGFYSGWSGGRIYRVDMAGFAVNLDLLIEVHEKLGTSLKMPYEHGYEEDGFLKMLGVPPQDAEPLCRNCTEVLVWHTKTIPHQATESKNGSQFDETNIPALLGSV